MKQVKRNVLLRSCGAVFMGWLRVRRMVLFYVALVNAIFFAVYGLYGYDWSVAGYASLLGLAAGVGLAAWDFTRFAARHHAYTRIVSRFPVHALPETDNLLEEEAQAVIRALEAERVRLEQENERNRRDAEEYYTLWAHQIKNPIAAMRLLLQSNDTRTEAESKAALEQELFRIEQYVGMVLQYQRLSSMRNDLALQKHDVGKLVKKAAKSCAALFIYKKLSFTMEALPVSIVTDEKWFCFVIEQILTNAVKYTAKGGVRVYAPDGETLAVEDSGTGILPEDLPRVFERGFTGAVGRSERSSTGIGLYLCQEILTCLGFGISIASSPGKGTQVLLHLRQNPLEVE